MRIGSYTPLLSSSQQIQQKTNSLQQSTQQIATGKKVNTAADNAAAVAILEGMYGQISGLETSNTNSQNTVSLLNTAEGSMSSSTDAMQQLRSLGVQAGNGTLTTEDRSAIQQEMSQLAQQINANAANTQYNGINTNDGTLNITTLAGANSGQFLSATLANMSADALGVSTDVSSQAKAAESLTAIDSGLQKLLSARSSNGATINGLETSINANQQAATNLQSAAAGIGDTDIASESSLLQQTQIQLYASVMAMSKSTGQTQSLISLVA